MKFSDYLVPILALWWSHRSKRKHFFCWHGNDRKSSEQHSLVARYRLGEDGVTLQHPFLVLLLVWCAQCMGSRWICTSCATCWERLTWSSSPSSTLHADFICLFGHNAAQYINVNRYSTFLWKDRCIRLHVFGLELYRLVIRRRHVLMTLSHNPRLFKIFSVNGREPLWLRDILFQLSIVVEKRLARTIFRHEHSFKQSVQYFCSSLAHKQAFILFGSAFRSSKCQCAMWLMARCRTNRRQSCRTIYLQVIRVG